MKKFTKESFNTDEILSSASNLKYITKFKEILAEDFVNPSEDFIKYFAKQVLIGKVITSKVSLEFSEIVKSGINQYVNDLVNNKLKIALKTTEENEEVLIEVETAESDNPIITTEEEMEGYYIIKSIGSEIVSSSRIIGKDTLSYFGILLDNKVTQWFARLRFTENKKMIAIATKDKQEIKFEINNVNEIYNYKDQIKEALSYYLK